ncbi:MAG: hypothetical protein ACRD0K_28800 [Egibacteraceae bacterium]
MSAFDEAVLAICRDVLGGPAVERHTLALVRQGLAAQVRTSYPTLGDISDDLVDEAICRLVERTAGGEIRLDDHPGGYLRVVADRLALQWIRRAEARLRAAGASVPDTVPERDDDSIALLIGRLSDAADAHRALDAAIDARDHHATKVLQTYIDHAWRSQDWPLLRGGRHRRRRQPPHRPRRPAVRGVVPPRRARALAAHAPAVRPRTAMTR